MDEVLEKKRRVSPWIIIILGFAAVILAGTVLLMLPISSGDGRSAPFGDSCQGTALFGRVVLVQAKADDLPHALIVVRLDGADDVVQTWLSFPGSSISQARQGAPSQPPRFRGAAERK